MKKGDVGPVMPASKGERPERGAGPGTFKSQDGYATAYRTLNPNTDLVKTLIAGPKGGATSTKGAIAAPKTPGSYGKNG